MPDKISPFGKKYGTRGRFGWKRSGFTPIDLNFSEMNNKNLSKLQIERLKSIDFQRKHLYGFTTRELEELDALSDRPLRKPNLDNPIISYLDFDHWHDGGSKWGHKVEAPPFPVPKHHKTQGFLKKLKGVEKYHYSTTTLTIRTIPIIRNILVIMMAPKRGMRSPPTPGLGGLGIIRWCDQFLNRS